MDRIWGQKFMHIFISGLLETQEYECIFSPISPTPPQKCNLLVMGVIVNFTSMCLLDWAKECPHIWLNIILSASVSVSVFLDKINM